MDPTHPYLWCSDTLYSIAKKQSLKIDFKSSINEFHHWNDLINFHEKGAQPIDSTVFLKKVHGLQTVSITSLKYQNEHLDLYYNNLLKDKNPLKNAI